MALSLYFRVLLFLLSFLLSSMEIAGTNVDSLPGYGKLNFKLETGYIGVGENEEVQLFYYFIQSERTPETDPLLLWIHGGPCCSSLAGIFFENGPLALDINNYNGSLPTLIDNEDAWTKKMSIIYIDAPVGTGYSYSTTPDGYSINDDKFVKNTFEFLQKWFAEHESFRKNSFYLAGEGYSGNIVPVVIQKILDANAIEPDQAINIKGYITGNPGTDTILDFNSRVEAAYNLALIPKDIYVNANSSCEGQFFPSPSDQSSPCAQAITTINKLLCNIDPTHALNPSCATSCSQLIPLAQVDTQCNNIPLPYPSTKTCEAYIQNVTGIWANNEPVQAALQIRKNSIATWFSCNGSNYDHSGSASVISYHQNFVDKQIPLRGLIYSGDHDLSITYVGTLKWIYALNNLQVVEEWKSWCVDGETAGYTKKFQSGDYKMRFATIKGSGHYAAKLKPQASALVKTWIEEDIVLVQSA